MKILKLSAAGIFILIIMISCSSNKQKQLDKLKLKHTEIGEKIKTLEDELKSTGSDSPNSAKFKFVGLLDVKSGTFDHFIKVQGKLDGDQNAGVFAEVPGTITAKYSDVGQHVVKGQILAQIDDQQYRSQLESLETQSKLAADIYEKQQRLWEQKIGSEVQYLQAKTSMESLELQIESLKQQIEKFKIKSPISGTIEECNIRVGGVVSPDPRLAVYRVVEFKNLKVTAEVSEAYAARVQQGDRVHVSFPDAGKDVETKVSFVSKYINPVNRSFLIETDINSSSPDLKANMIAIIQINDYHNDKSITIPMNVIQNDESGSYVYVVRSKENLNAAFKQTVELGNSYNGVAEIVKGLLDGDKVISVGFQELVDGEFVRY